MQRNAPQGAHGRVFVRYEVVFQLAWVGGAFIPALLPIDFRTGILMLAAFYVGSRPARTCGIPSGASARGAGPPAGRTESGGTP